MTMSLLIRPERRRLRLLASSSLDCTLWPGSTSQQGQQEACSTSACSTSRCLHTSLPTQWEKFDRLLRQPVPKAHVLNRTNFEAWRNSSLDIGLAQQLLADMDAKAQLSKGRNVAAAVKSLVEAATILPELELVEAQVGDHMTPELLLTTCVHALTLRDQAVSSPVDSHTPHPSYLWQQASGLISALLARLPEQLTELSTKQLSLVLYCMARGNAGMQDVQEAVAREISNGAYRFSRVEPGVLANMMQSAARLGWARHQQGAWAILNSNVMEREDLSNPTVVSKLIGAACALRDPSTLVGWAKITASVNKHAHAWMQRHPALVADMLFNVARASSDLHAALHDATHTVAQLVSTGTPAALAALPTRALARLAFALAKLRGGQGQGTDRSTEAVITLICSVAANNVVRMPLNELSLLLVALAMQSGPSWSGRPPLVHVVRDVVAVRGLVGPASVGHTLALIGHLATLQGPQQPLLQLLADRAIKLLPRLPPRETSALAQCWVRHARPDAAGQVVTAAATQLLAVNTIDPDSVLDMLRCGCQVLGASESRPDTGSARQVNGLQAVLVRLADVVGDEAVGKLPPQVQKRIQELRAGQARP